MTEPPTASSHVTEHPTPDELADLLADALPPPQAASIADHLEGCASCLDLLAAAEGMGRLLRAVDDVPMPDDVAARLHEVVRHEVAQASAGGGERISAFDELRAAGAITEREAAVGGPRLLRRPQGPQITRRDRRDEQRGTRPRRIPGRQALLVAAGAVVVAGVGVGVVTRFAGTPRPADEASTAAAKAENSAALVSVTESGRNYTKSGLDAQVKALVGARVTRADSSGTAQTYASSPAPMLDRVAGNQALLDPAALAACLTTIGADGQRPVAVDLATYDGRDVAVIVLPGRNGGFEVSVVARDCRPGADGTLVVTSVPE